MSPADASKQIAEVVRAAAEVVKLDELDGGALARLRSVLEAAVVVVYRYGESGEPARIGWPLRRLRCVPARSCSRPIRCSKSRARWRPA